jgi:FkbM family methyltransferase
MSDAVAVARALRSLHAGIVTPDYEKLLCQSYHRFLWSNPSAVILDIGAHDGFHLDYFARLIRDTGRVIAFEPLPHLAAALSQRYRGRPGIEIRAVALGSEQGTASFNFVKESPGESGLRQHAYNVSNPTIETITVATDTLDRQAAGLDRLAYIKMDIEGGEIDCLRSGQAAIARHQPFISVEYGQAGYSAFGNTEMTLFELADEMDYLLSDLFGNLIETKDDWVKICDLAYWDYFLVPRRRQAEWRQYFSD